MKHMRHIMHGCRSNSAEVRNPAGVRPSAQAGAFYYGTSSVQYKNPILVYHSTVE